MFKPASYGEGTPFVIICSCSRVCFRPRGDSLRYVPPFSRATAPCAVAETRVFGSSVRLPHRGETAVQDDAGTAHSDTVLHLRNFLERPRSRNRHQSIDRSIDRRFGGWRPGLSMVPKQWGRCQPWHCRGRDFLMVLMNVDDFFL